MARKRKKGRGRPSSIDLLPEDLRVRLNDALRDKRLTQQQILSTFNQLLSERGEPQISRSALNRYAVHVEEMGAMMREAREAASALVGGIKASESDVGRAVTELIKTMTFDLIDRMRTGEEAPNVETLGELALLAQRVERASKTGLERELKLREQFMSEQKQKLDKAESEGALHKEAAQAAREILGFV